MAENNKKDKPSFWKGVKSEFSKITWPDREAMIKQTAMVVFISMVLGIIIASLDFVLQYGVDFVTTVGTEQAIVEEWNPEDFEIDFGDLDFGDFEFDFDDMEFGDPESDIENGIDFGDLGFEFGDDLELE